jgi:ribosomal protein S14
MLYVQTRARAGTKNSRACVISGFRRGVIEVFALLGYYAAFIVT